MSANQLTGVPRMMIFTLRARADEHRRPDALFRDERSARWMEQLPWDDELSRWYDWRYQLGIALRTHRLDDVADRFIRSHDRPLVVELAAGLSTRYYRVGEGRARWVELDLPESMAVRRQLDAESPEHRFLTGSALDSGWMDQLPDAPAENILFVTEGLLMYLDYPEVRRLVDSLRQRFAGATWTMDVFGHVFKKLPGKHVKEFGAPMKWSVRDERDVAALGLTLGNVWPVFREPGPRVRWFRWLSWIPAVRNAALVLETRIQPPSYG